MSDQRGMVTVEYAIVLVLLSLGGCLAIATLGPLLQQLLAYQRALIALPFP